MATTNPTGATNQTPKKCVSWGEVTDPWNVGSAERFRLTGSETAILPHIETCVGIIYKLQSGETVCIHASATPEDTSGVILSNDGTHRLEALRQAHVKAQQLIGNDTIVSVMAVGTPEWGPLLKTHLPNPQFESTAKHKNGVDVTVSSDGSFTVVPYQKA